MLVSPSSTTRDASQDVRVVVAESLAELKQFHAPWQDLASAAIEPNPFHEPWMLEPAAEFLGSEYDLRFVLILAPGDPSYGTPMLLGFFPLELRRSCGRYPARTMCLWKHRYCFLSVPLLREGYARQALGAFLDWLARNPFGCRIMRFETVTGDGPFHALLSELLEDRRRLNLMEERRVRALLRRSESAEAYLDRAMSRKHLKDLQKRERRLAQLGRIGHVALEPGADVEPWIADFLRLEESGWKGRAGTALAQQKPDAEFFRAIVRNAHRLGRLMMLGLCLEDKPIALKCNFLCGRGSFAFKMAYDESYAPYSPGLLVEVDNLKQVHAAPALEWMDSCVGRRGSLMLDRFWTEHRVVETVLVSSGSRAGDFWILVIRLLRWMRRAWHVWRQKTLDPMASPAPLEPVSARTARGGPA